MGCGGSSSPPAPPTLTITTSSVPNAVAQQAYGVTLKANGGTGTDHWNIASGSLAGGLTLDSTGNLSGTPSGVGTFNFSVQVTDSGQPPQTAKKALTLTVVLPPGPTITTSALPSGKVNGNYAVQFGAMNGLVPLVWNLSPAVTPNLLPPGMSLDPSGTLSGSPTVPGSTSFTVRVTDAAGRSADRALTFTAVNAPGRNDSIATATALSNGTLTASISPFNDSGSSVTTPDGDFYKLTANPGATVSVETFAQRLPSVPPLDTVIEILDGRGNRLQTCKDPGAVNPPAPITPDPTPDKFDNPCINDDIDLGALLDSRLMFQTASGGGPVTFYVHVIDFRGDARPDMIYQLQITGAN